MQRHRFAKNMCLILLAFGSTGCNSMKLEKLISAEPQFSFIDYFAGHTKASGWFSDRFGNVKRHFCGDFYGELDRELLVLDEKLYYTDNIQENRIWTVSIDENGKFAASSDSLVGKATGQQSGNGLNLAYRMNVLVATDKVWTLDMDDYMFYQPDGSLHNITRVKKWGLTVGTVSTQYEKHAGEKTCAQSATQALGSGRPNLRILSTSTATG